LAPAKRLSSRQGYQGQGRGSKGSGRSPEAKAHVKIEGDKIIAELETGVYGLASGQALVVYQNDLVLGGGWIEA
jgi:tRNA-specific 2-thiouridylase